MTDQEINIAIAEALGRKYHAPTPEEVQSGSYYQYQPDFCHDLNAMHEAEETLSGESRLLYVDSLLSLIHDVDAGYFSRIEWQHGAELLLSDARQRAEAFLRVKGLWKEQ